MRKRCPGCGSLSRGESPFCSRCGAALPPDVHSEFLVLESVSCPAVRLELSKARVTIGCTLDNDVVIGPPLDGWETVSPYHARVERRGSEWVLLDGLCDAEPSTNGIFVDGKRTRENYLWPGARIAFGSVEAAL